MSTKKATTKGDPPIVDSEGVGVTAHPVTPEQVNVYKILQKCIFAEDHIVLKKYEANKYYLIQDKATQDMIMKYKWAKPADPQKTYELSEPVEVKKG